MDITSTLGEARENQKGAGEIPRSVIDSITHDIVNHLSVICLCCCELRNSVGEKMESNQLQEFKRIEVAVQDAAEKIQQLKRILKAYPPADDGRQSESFSAEQKKAMPSASPWLA